MRNFRITPTLCEFFSFSISALPNPKPLSLISLFHYAYDPRRTYLSSQSSERAASVRAPLDAPPHLADSASQSRYHTRRASATPVAPTQIPPRGPPTKKAKTSEPREVPPAPSTSAPSEPVPEAASSDAPPTVPPTSEPPITIPGSEYRALLASFQTLTTTQTAIMERMDHFQIQQEQQTLILREIQQHLGLVPPAPPVEMPSSVPAEGPSYPPEEPTT